jgi:hypothetical protein
VIEKVNDLTTKFAANACPPLFREDPVILRKVSPEGPIMVIEGRHRISALCAGLISDVKVGACLAYLGKS